MLSGAKIQGAKVIINGEFVVYSVLQMKIVLSLKVEAIWTTRMVKSFTVCLYSYSMPRGVRPALLGSHTLQLDRNSTCSKDEVT